VQVVSVIGISAGPLILTLVRAVVREDANFHTYQMLEATVAHPISEWGSGQKGGRKAPSFVNQAWTLYSHFFWDVRAGSLEEQALRPIANPIGIRNTHQATIKSLHVVAGYNRSFKEAKLERLIAKEA